MGDFFQYPHIVTTIISIAVAILVWLAKREVTRMDLDREELKKEIKEMKECVVWRGEYMAGHQPLVDSVKRIEDKIDALLLRK